MELTTEQKIDEVWKLFKETDRKMQETDRRMKETDRRMKETDIKIKELADLFTGQWGKLIEALIEPGVLQLFTERTIYVKQVYRRVESFLYGRKMEIDLLLTSDKEIVAIEVKTTLKVEYVRNFLDDLAEFLDFFPRFTDCRIYGAVAAVSIEEEADKFAYRHGLFVLKAGKEGIIQILNDLKFKPKNFGKEDT